MTEQTNSKNISRNKVYIILVLILIALTLLLITGKAKKAGFIDSNDLTQTAFVATLDSNLPEHKNVIWCATFQMAWDKLKNDIIKEPVKLINAQDLADQMNRSEFPPSNLDANSYYAAAGFVKDGIIEKVIAEMKKRFPEEPTPVFNAGYHSFANPILAYAYLNANIQFKNLFYTYKKPFTFESSNMEKTDVTAFSCAIEENARAVNYYKVMDQIIVLYFERGKDVTSNYFAVDLCKYTQPYQVILALVPQKNTFQEMISDVENKIASYKKYDWNWPEFSQTDNLIVPDVITKITHDYKEFIMKEIGNEPWKSNRYGIFDAQQTIDFSLSKSGVVIKSQAKGGGGMMGGGSEPRYMYFNRPFMIYIKKRQADAKPFFVMWIDNAELLKKLKVEAK
jgi:hypothetical protein